MIKTNLAIKIDTLDFEIMTHLSDNGRKSFTEIASQLGVSVATVRNRTARLIADKVLTVYGRVDPNRVGFHAYAQIFVSVRPVQRLEAVARQIAAFPEVTFLASIAGDYDLEVNVMCCNNEHLNRLMRERLHRIDGVHHTKTTMYLRVHKMAQADLNLLKHEQDESTTGNGGFD